MTDPWRTEEIVKCEQGEFPAPTVVPDDLELVQRISKSYRFGMLAGRQNADPYAPGTWKYIFDGHLSGVDKILGSDDIDEITKLLRDPGSSTLFYGFDDLAQPFVSTRPKPFTDKNLKFSLHRFAELMGFIRLYLPEADGSDLYAVAPWLAKPELTPDGFLDSLERELGVPIKLPNIYRAEAGFITNRGLLSTRSLYALYVAVKIISLLGGIKGKRVLEIGAGLARTAYYGVLFGAAQYDVVDIPTTAASQGYFLGRTLGADSVRLQGEEVARFNVKARLLAPSEFLALDDRYDIIVNIDSLPEIPEAQASTYADHLLKLTPKFLSINHEANNLIVPNLFKGKPGVSRQRSHFALRPGYAEDVYTFSNNS